MLLLLLLLLLLLSCSAAGVATSSALAVLPSTSCCRGQAIHHQPLTDHINGHNNSLCGQRCCSATCCTGNPSNSCGEKFSCSPSFAVALLVTSNEVRYMVASRHCTKQLFQSPCKNHGHPQSSISAVL